jgi:UTP--glucose-1-phosphate uridylyltransferase
VKKPITKAVFPAAGLGTRFLPATKASPKEMMPLVDKPLIQYVVEEAVSSGIEQVVVITGRGKRAIEDHFDVAFELEEDLKAKGKTGSRSAAYRQSGGSATFVRKGARARPRSVCMGRRRRSLLLLLGDDIIDSKCRRSGR